MKPQSCRTTLSLVLGGLVAGCATPEGSSALECGVGGAVAAVALCKIMGGNNARCAAIGAAAGGAGGAACYSYAQNIQKRRAALAERENDLDARIAYLRGVNHDTEELNRRLSERVRVVTASTDEAVAALQRGQTTRAELAEQRRQLDVQVSSAQNEVASAKRELQSSQAFRDRQGHPSPALDAEVARLEGLLADAQRKTTALAAQRQRI